MLFLELVLTWIEGKMVRGISILLVYSNSFFVGLTPVSFFIRSRVMCIPLYSVVVA